MLRILFFLLVVFLLGVGFAWLAERPGELVLTVAGYRYELTLMAAAVMLAVIVAAVMLAWWVLRGVWNSPYMVARYFRVRRRDRGYQALSTGLIAAGSGDGGQARRMVRQAGKLIDSDREPLIHLLDAQAALLEGDHDTARETFEAMLKDPEMRLLGLRGLYLEAERLGEREAARHYAAEAAEAAPQLGWAVEATLEQKTQEGDWAGALKLVEAQKATRQADREALARRRAVLLTAQAAEQLDSDPAAARVAALEANRLQPDFVPAAVLAAKAYFRQNDLRRGSKVLEAIWRKEPHPEIAEAYVHARTGDSTHDRLARAKKLRGLKANNIESSLAVARAALEAGEFKEARAAVEAAIRLAPRESAYLLLADIEEQETGDQGRVRHWLNKALRAPRDPAWVADGYVSERWAPYSPVTGRFDAFEWRVPMARLGQVIEGEEPEDTLPVSALAAPPEADDAAEADVVEAETVVMGLDRRPPEAPPPEPAAEPHDAPRRADADAGPATARQAA
ncbi:heme biosynthesis protein HemY, partial [Aquibium sp. A9E412]|uniref:heme biosynthesis protein HemY n=1 Tax=Aquibium sp. A9E412 TaxID=2976767 RepID=UPI0025B1D77B